MYVQDDVDVVLLDVCEVQLLRLLVTQVERKKTSGNNVEGAYLLAHELNYRKCGNFFKYSDFNYNFNLNFFDGVRTT